MADKVRVAVLISGRGSNMLALAEHKRRDPDRSYEIMLVASNVPEARGLVLAKRLGLKTWALSHQGMERRDFDLKLDAVLREHDIELVALAGY
ncbi:MAG: formyltransferase family protein, partial [Allosphingosinicella sp.]